MPRATVIDLWGSATLRTGGEEIAQGLALMGCRPTWEPATGRITGIEVLPMASVGRPRVDVTWRISGLFRDLFPAQIALIDAAVRAVAAREEPPEDNPLAVARQELSRRGASIARIFGTAPANPTHGTLKRRQSSAISPTPLPISVEASIAPSPVSTSCARQSRSSSPATRANSPKPGSSRAPSRRGH